MWPQRLVCVCVVQLTVSAVNALTFDLPAAEEGVIGAVAIERTGFNDTLSDLARRSGHGYQEMKLANPDIEPWKPGVDIPVTIPSQYILPDTPRKGLVINIPEMRIYYYGSGPEQDGAQVQTYPISIGRQQWATPLGLTKIVSKVRDPDWYPPESIREEHAALDDPLPRIVPAGPDNPLGTRAIKLGLPGYLLHGTNKPYGVGMRVSHGCIRLYPEDIEALFEIIPLNTEVRLVNQPFKTAWRQNDLFLEVHPPLVEEQHKYSNAYSHVMGLLQNLEREVRIEWDALEQAVANASGVPVQIGTAVSPAAMTGIESNRLTDWQGYRQ